MLVLKYFDDVHEIACRKAATAKGKGDGTRAAFGVWDALSFLERHWGLAFNATVRQEKVPDADSVRGSREAAGGGGHNQSIS